MNNTDRNSIDGSIMLSRNKDGSNQEKYIIKSIIDEGDTFVCYEAVRMNSEGITESGRLKGFYLNGANTENNEFISAYKQLQNAVLEKQDNEILKSYIQNGEILYGSLESGKDRIFSLKKKLSDIISGKNNVKPTVYIWTTRASGKGFDEYIDEIKKKPKYKSEEKLKNILYVLIELTDCMNALHTAGLMHLDIKPSNFLMQYDSDFRIKAKSIALLDTNTLCSIDYQTKLVEANYGPDLYSLGAMLFNAIVVSENIKDGLYKDSYYSDIRQIVKHSELLVGSETNSDSTLLSKICSILEKCLTENPDQRYQNCSELIKDLKSAEKRLEKILLTPVEDTKQGNTSSTLVIQKLLYDHPLYETADRDDENLNVLVLGAGTYGQKFIDIALQSGQMSNKMLRIDVVSEDAEEYLKNYLSFRTKIKSFVNVNGSANNKKYKYEPYGELWFHDISEYCGAENSEMGFTLKQSQHNKDIADSIISKSVQTKNKYDYVFVALGNDKTSKSIAKLFADKMDYSCPVVYISDKTKRMNKQEENKRIYSLFINEPLDYESFDENLGRMAFNTHISWNSTSILNMNIAEEKNKFYKSDDEKDRYNMLSSMAFVLSIKYKLHSVGIDCDDIYEAARMFSEKILEKKEKDKDAFDQFNELVALEHRRWVLEKVTDGWRPLEKNKNGNMIFKYCLKCGSVKDIEHRIHPCIVHSLKNAPLSSEEYSKNNHEKWDCDSKDPNLDELDTLSIQMHRFFKKCADELKRNNVINDPNILYIKSRISNTTSKKVQISFNQLQFAIKNVINGVESYSSQFNSYIKAFKDTLDVFDVSVKSDIEERLKIIERIFFPMIESNMYRDYKSYDEVLVSKIPFILTFKYKSTIAMGFSDGKYQNGRNEAVFPDVASSTVLCPERINYLYYIDEKFNNDLFLKKLDAVVNYFSQRKVNCEIHLVAVYKNTTSNKILDLFKNGLINIRNKYTMEKCNAALSGVALCSVKDSFEASEKFIEYLKENPVDLFDGDNMIYESAYDNAIFINKIIEEKIPYFEFDSMNKAFVSLINCDYLKYVKDGSFIRITDMFALMNATENRHEMPEYANEYEKLWDLYTGSYLAKNKFEDGVKTWNNLCIKLEDYDKVQAPIAKLERNLPNANERDVKDYDVEYYLPEYTYITAKYIVDQLKEYGIINKKSQVESYASDTCIVSIKKTDSRYKDEINKIFAKPQYLLPYYGITVEPISQYIVIKYNKLSVKNIKLSKGNENFKETLYYKLLKELNDNQFISQLSVDTENSVSFNYSSPRLKKILTCAGELLEVYAFYDVMKTGYFDDVASGFEFNWEEGGVKNELDLVVTKGFRSIIVECKSVVSLKLDFYHKLHSIADQFGIGTTKVLLGNTYEHSKLNVRKTNEMQKSRGKQLQIITLSSEEQVKNIGRELVNIIKNEVI